MAGNSNKFGNALRLARENAGYTQEQAAEKVGYTSRAAISIIEKGKSGISIDKLNKLAELYGVSVSDLMDAAVSEDPEPGAPTGYVMQQTFSQEDQGQRLARYISMLAAMDSNDKERVFDYIDILNRR